MSHGRESSDTTCLANVQRKQNCGKAGGWSNLDGSVKALKALPGDAIVGEVAPVGSIVTIALQEDDVRFTDDNVIRGGVVVQLLVPILQQSIRSRVVHCTGVLHVWMHSEGVCAQKRCANHC